MLQAWFTILFKILIYQPLYRLELTCVEALQGQNSLVSKLFT